MIDGQPRGTTPLSVRTVALGPHAVQISLSGYEPHAQEVVLSADDPVAAVNVTLGAARGAAAPAGEAGAILVESRPGGAQVFLDGKLIGTTPLQMSTVTPGRHDVRIQLDGYQVWSTAVDVRAGQRTRVAASLDGAPRR
jgi:hypothetical protein